MDVKNEDGKKEKLPLYLDGESVSGKVGPCSSRTSLILSSPFPFPLYPSELTARRSTRVNDGMV